MQLTIFCDGASRGNPGPAASAFCVYENKSLLHEEGRVWGITTNNVAEYKAVVMAYEWLLSFLANNRVSKIEFIFDSELVTKQLNGEYKIKSPLLRPLVLYIKQMENNIDASIIYSHVKREHNTRADQLANEALDNQMKS